MRCPPPSVQPRHGRAAGTVVLAGDGAFGYAVGELATLVEHRLPVTIVVLNNRSLGWIRWYRRIDFGRGWEDEDFGDVAFADVARAFGLRGQRVTRRGSSPRPSARLRTVPGPRWSTW